VTADVLRGEAASASATGELENGRAIIVGPPPTASAHGASPVHWNARSDLASVHRHIILGEQANAETEAQASSCLGVACLRADLRETSVSGMLPSQKSRTAPAAVGSRDERLVEQIGENRMSPDRQWMVLR